ncbi:hypothetical protein BRD56_04540 [Thermoplasmatales archaeon SW_10_69_26]|nr:MAG: hypothetical protein BRD56_04540 [Thermoplasmatales archaeon SW_10_69_26]
MVDLGALGILAQAGTGFFVLLVGLVALVSASPRRHTVSFALFLVLWGGLLLAGNFATLAVDAGNLAQAEELLILHAVLQGLAFLPLIVFTLSYPPSQQTDLGRWPVLAAVLAPPLAVLATVLVDPGLFHEGFATDDGGLEGSWGIGKAGVFLAFRLAIYATLARLVLVREHLTNDLERRQALSVLLGFSLFIGYESMQDLLLFAGTATDPMNTSLPSIVFAATSALGVGVLAWVGVRLLGRRGSVAGVSRGLTVGCLAGSLALGLISGASSTWSAIPEISGASLWRVGAVALIVSAVTWFEQAEPDRILPRLAAVFGWLSLAAAVLLTMHLGLASLLGSSLYAFVALWGSLVAGAAAVAIHRPGTFAEVLRRLRRKRSSVGQARRDLELYEAALLSGRETQTLDDLRQQMGISSAEHQVMERLTDPHSAMPIPERGPFRTGDVVDDRYELEELLGEGASSHVFRARDRPEDRTVALKILDRRNAGSPQALREFVHESRVCLRLRHPHFLDTYDLGEVEGQPYLSFELAESGSLAEAIGDDGLETEHATRLIEGVLAGLQHLHEEGLVHRDLKPSNLLIDEDGRANIGDLGLAYSWDAERTQQLGPETGGFREGTPAYMSPETLMGHPPSPASDVYAVGAILVEAVTGAHYLGLQGAPYATVRKAVLDTPPRLHRIDPDLVPICRRALHKDPSRRYGSAAEMREAILETVSPRREHTDEMIWREIGHRGSGRTASPPPPPHVAVLEGLLVARLEPFVVQPGPVRRDPKVDQPELAVPLEDLGVLCRQVGIVLQADLGLRAAPDDPAAPLRRVGIDVAQVVHLVVLGSLQEDELGSLAPFRARLVDGALGVEGVDRALGPGSQQLAKLLEQTEDGRLVDHVLTPVAPLLVRTGRGPDEVGFLQPGEVVADALAGELAVFVLVLGRPSRCEVDVVDRSRLLQLGDQSQTVRGSQGPEFRSHLFQILSPR